MDLTTEIRPSTRIIQLIILSLDIQDKAQQEAYIHLICDHIVEITTELTTPTSSQASHLLKTRRELQSHPTPTLLMETMRAAARLLHQTKTDPHESAFYLPRRRIVSTHALLSTSEGAATYINKGKPFAWTQRTPERPTAQQTAQALTALLRKNCQVNVDPFGPYDHWSFTTQRPTTNASLLQAFAEIHTLT